VLVVVVIVAAVASCVVVVVVVVVAVAAAAAAASMGSKKTASWSTPLNLVLILGTVGLGVSIFLVVDHFDESDSSFCDFASHISCSKIKHSVYSEILNVPVAVGGVLWFVVLMLLALAAKAHERASSLPRTLPMNVYVSALFFWSFMGTVFVFYLVFAEFLLRAICPFCTIVHIITIAVFGLSFRLREQQHHQLQQSASTPSSATSTYKPTLFDTVMALRVGLAVLLMVSLLIVIYFNAHAAAISAQKELEKDSVPVAFAQCIASRGWKMYGKSSCGSCTIQKNLFGNAFSHIAFMDCLDVDWCTPKKVDRFPTWILEQDDVEVDRKVGIVQLQDFAALTGCVLNA
jgi:uncharacterized membrane protein